MLGLAAFLLLARGEARAQGGTDVWLADLEVRPDGLRVGAAFNATRRPGYDNQPSFLAGGAFLYSAGDSAGTDIWRWDPVLRHGVRVTRTPESEYSPTPFLDGAPGFCAVRVEADSTQRLWRFDEDGGNPALVLSAVDSVGYFEWIDAASLAIFVVGAPHTLRIVDVATQHETVAARDIGRFIRCVPGTRDAAFTIRNPDDTYRFFLLAYGAQAPVGVMDCPGAGQDAVWVGDFLIATNGPEIMMARPGPGAGWQHVADVREWGAAGATRLAVSRDQTRLAVVCAE